MTTACCENLNIIPRKRVRSDVAGRGIVVFLVCLTVIVQYVMLMVYGGDSEVENADFGIARYFALINCCIYFIIVLINLEKIKKWQIALFLFGIIYLFVNTLIRGKGYLHMFSYVQLLTALIIFSQMRLSRKSVKQICFFSVFVFLALYLILSYDGTYFYSETLNLKLNKNHFCKLAIVNLFLALTALRKDDRKIHLSYLIVYAVWLYIIIPTDSRMALLCLLAVIFFHIISIKLKKINTKKLLRFFIFCLALSACAVFILTYVVPSVLGDDFMLLGRPLLSGRNAIYLDAFGTLSRENDWLFGHGFLQFTELKGHIGNYRTDTHNQWLQFALNYGLVFAIFMIVAYVKVYKHSLKSNPSYATLFITFFQIVLFMYFLTETMYHISVYSCLFNVMYFTVYKGNNGGSRKRKLNLDYNRRKTL